MTDRGTDSISPGKCGAGGAKSALTEVRQLTLALAEPEALANNLMEQVCQTDNLSQAYKRVRSNKGAPGVDGMTIKALPAYVEAHRAEILSCLLDGSYQAQPVRGVKIPKPQGGERQLGIPTVLDRVIQQAIVQVIEPLFDPGFSDSSYGFRPGRSAHQAIRQASSYVESGKRYVVDIDLEKYFDRVNHDILMSRLARKIGDKRLLKIIRGFLNAGLMQNGLYERRDMGTPQGGPLSPLLSNILLDDLDKELERRDHKFCRYADDCNIYVGSQAAGERVMESISQFLEKRLRLKVNQSKSAVALTQERQFLGFRLWSDGRVGLSAKSLKRLKDKVRQLTKRNRGVSLELVMLQLKRYLMGWINYYQLIASRSLLRDLDGWIRRRLRCYRLKQRKRKYGVARFLMKLGISSENAWRLAKSEKSWWRKSHNPVINTALSNAWFHTQGLLSLVERYDELKARLKPPYAT